MSSREYGILINSHYAQGSHTICLYLMYYCPCTTNLQNWRLTPYLAMSQEHFQEAAPTNRPQSSRQAQNRSSSSIKHKPLVAAESTRAQKPGEEKWPDFQVKLPHLSSAHTSDLASLHILFPVPAQSGLSRMWKGNPQTWYKLLKENMNSKIAIFQILRKWLQ